MNHLPSNERIVTDPAVLLGKPIVKGTRVPVYLIVGLVEAGQSPARIVLTVEDVEADIACAAQEMVHPGDSVRLYPLCAGRIDDGLGDQPPARVRSTWRKPIASCRSRDDTMKFGMHKEVVA